jgi:ATP-dependent RNA helicase DDX10/DBP4
LLYERDLDPKAAVKKELPLSDPTASGLVAFHYKTLTDIQSPVITYALMVRVDSVI